MDGYNKEFIRSTLKVLEDDLHDLSMWSVHNDDKYNEEIYIIKQTIKSIKENI